MDFKEDLKKHFSDYKYHGSNLVQKNIINKSFYESKEEYNTVWINENKTLKDFFRIVKVSDAYFPEKDIINEINTSPICLNQDGFKKKSFNIKLNNFEYDEIGLIESCSM